MALANTVRSEAMDEAETAFAPSGEMTRRLVKRGWLAANWSLGMATN